jgi:glycolate oxidase FAD binding subunit
VTRAPNAIEACACETIVEPESADEIAEIVLKCERDRITLAPIGAARSLADLRAQPVALGVSLARMTRVIAYEPDDMTVVAEPGITLASLNDHMAAHRQRLPLDPANPAATTLGAMIGAAKAGPVRLSEGLVRDLMIGIRFVGHGGRIVRAGGRVVKNVAGYDLMKVLTGSFGTLGIVTEATFKVRPIPELYALALKPCDQSADAFAAAGKLHDALPLSHLEVLSGQLGAAFGAPGKFLVLAGVSGNEREVEYQLTKIAELAEPVETLRAARASETYERLRDFEFAVDALIAQLAVPPAELARCLAGCGAEFRAHAGCGVAQLSSSAANPNAARAIVARWRALAAGARGHLRLLAAPSAARAGLEFFDRPNAGALGLMRRLKASFDPVGIFNPGCFVGGI